MMPKLTSSLVKGVVRGVEYERGEEANEEREGGYVHFRDGDTNGVP